LIHHPRHFRVAQAGGDICQGGLHLFFPAQG
jgi:hypothetical protein